MSTNPLDELAIPPPPYPTRRFMATLATTEIPTESTEDGADLRATAEAEKAQLEKDAQSAKVYQEQKDAEALKALGYTNSVEVAPATDIEKVTAGASEELKADAAKVKEAIDAVPPIEGATPAVLDQDKRNKEDAIAAINQELDIADKALKELEERGQGDSTQAQQEKDRIDNLATKLDQIAFQKKTPTPAQKFTGLNLGNRMATPEELEEVQNDLKKNLAFGGKVGRIGNKEVLIKTENGVTRTRDLGTPTPEPAVPPEKREVLSGTQAEYDFVQKKLAEARTSGGDTGLIPGLEKRAKRYEDYFKNLQGQKNTEKDKAPAQALEGVAASYQQALEALNAFRDPAGNLSEETLKSRAFKDAQSRLNVASRKMSELGTVSKPVEQQKEKSAPKVKNSLAGDIDAARKRLNYYVDTDRRSQEVEQPKNTPAEPVKDFDIEFKQPSREASPPESKQKLLNALNAYRDASEQFGEKDSRTIQAKARYRQLENPPAPSKRFNLLNGMNEPRPRQTEKPTDLPEVGSERVHVSGEDSKVKAVREQAKVQEQKGSREPKVEQEEESPIPGNAEEDVFRKIEEISQMGEKGDLSFWSRIGAWREHSIHGAARWWNSLGERIAKEKLSKREAGIVRLEAEAERYTKGSKWGEFWSPLKFGIRIAVARRRRDELDAGMRYFADRKRSHEDVRNEILNMSVHETNTLLVSYKVREAAYEKEAGELDDALDGLDTSFKEENMAIGMERDMKARTDLLDKLHADEERYRKISEARKLVDEKLESIRQEIIRFTQLKNRILRKAHTPTQSPDRELPALPKQLETRQRRQPKKPKTQAA